MYGDERVLRYYREDGSIATIHHAGKLGVSVLGTAHMYDPFTNKRLVGKAIVGRHDEKIVLATKFGSVRRRIVARSWSTAR